MKKKFIIIAGVILTIFILFLIVICGSATTNKTVTKEELETTISNITCNVNNGDDVNYDISIVTNDTSFDSVIQTKEYTKIIINKNKNVKSLGVAFIVKSSEDFNLNISLNKNNTSIKSTTVELKDGKMANVNLIIEEAVDISVDDEFSISFTQSGNSTFAFDTLLFFFDEV